MPRSTKSVPGFRVRNKQAIYYTCHYMLGHKAWIRLVEEMNRPAAIYGPNSEGLTVIIGYKPLPNQVWLEYGPISHIDTDNNQLVGLQGI